MHPNIPSSPTDGDYYYDKSVGRIMMYYTNQWHVLCSVDRKDNVDKRIRFIKRLINLE